MKVVRPSVAVAYCIGKSHLILPRSLIFSALRHPLATERASTQPKPDESGERRPFYHSHYERVID